MLNITLLGGASFSADGELVRCELGPGGRLLACYLFEFMGKAHRREKLTDLFWGELEPEKARSAFNTAVWRLRKLLELGQKGGGRYLATLGKDLFLEPAAFIHVDTRSLQEASKRALNLAKCHNVAQGDEGATLAAIESYGGPFLDGDDGDWILQERERLHCLFVQTTLALMRAAARRREHERALQYGRRVLAIDPLRESIQRDVMLLLVLNGQRAEAIRAYQRLRTMLKSDLGIDPMPDTSRLYHEVVSGEIFGRLEGLASSHFATQQT